ncbi:MAG: MDR family MFS transporter [Promethearchaeota archaeon]
MLNKVQKLTREFPKTFWVLIFATFIDRLGGFLLFPFFAIYVSDKFSASMTEVGFLFMAMSLGSMVGSFIGGAITDKVGRKSVMIFGLVVSGLGSILMGLVNDLNSFYILAVVLGLLGDVAGPARMSMIPDLLPKEKQSQGFGIIRVAVNISATIGPILGGFIASQSYMLLFIGDAVSSIITAFIVFAIIPETKPEVSAGKEETSMVDTLKGYVEVIKDSSFMLYLSISAVMILVYMQMYSTLSVFLRNQMAFTPELIGILMSVNAFLVVVLQFWITRSLAKIAPLKVMALGSLLFGIGFGLFGLVNRQYMIFIAMAIVTIGEMVTLPTSQGVVGKIAPADKRGRYMAIFGFSWGIPNLFGVVLAGLIMDNFNPNWVWYGAFILSMIAMGGFLVLHRTRKDRFSRGEPSKSDVEIEAETEEETKNEFKDANCLDGKCPDLLVECE